jgi:hypothetical protein
VRSAISLDESPVCREEAHRVNGSAGEAGLDSVGASGVQNDRDVRVGVVMGIDLIPEFLHLPLQLEDTSCQCVLCAPIHPTLPFSIQVYYTGEERSVSMDLYDDAYHDKVRSVTEQFQAQEWRGRDNLIQILAHQRAMIEKYDQAFALVRQGLLVLGPYGDDDES